MVTNAPLTTPLTPQPLTFDDLASQIVRSVGEVTDVVDVRYTMALQTTVPLLLQRRTPYARVHSDLPELYARRDAIEIAQGAVRQMIDTSGDDDSANLNQVFTNLAALWQQTQGELIRLTTIGNASRPPAVGRVGGYQRYQPVYPWAIRAASPIYANAAFIGLRLPFGAASGAYGASYGTGIGSSYDNLGFAYGQDWLAQGGVMNGGWWAASSVDAVNTAYGVVTPNEGGGIGGLLP